MKRIFLFLAMLIGIVYFSSCLQDHPNDLDLGKEVKVNALISNLTMLSTTSTRAYDSSWEKDDCIGLFMKNAGSDLTQSALYYNVKFKTDGHGSFTSEILDKMYFPFNNKKVDFISYYPHKDSLNGLEYEIDVSNQDCMSRIDLLYSNNVKDVNHTIESINLNFTHQLSKLVFIISENNTGKDLNGLSAKITNVNRKASFSLIDGSISDVKDKGDIKLNISNDNKGLHALLIPEANLDDEKLVITLGDATYTYKLSDSKIIKLIEKSMQYQYTIKLNKGQGEIIEGVTAEISDWGDPITEEIDIKEDPEVDGDNPDDDGNKDGEGDNQDPPSPERGNGSMDNPYSVAQVKLLQKGSKNKEIWVKGYIVGTYKNDKGDDFTKNISNPSEFYFALADKATEEDGENTYIVNLSISSNVLKLLNLKSNPNNLGKEVILKGDVGIYFTGYPLSFLNVKEAIMGEKSAKDY